MSTVNLEKWPQFRKDSLELQSNLYKMVGEMDVLMASNLNDSEKALKADRIVQKYLPDDG